ncbi:MAG TPA: hypothetical protein VNW04_16140 [Puia sp.]|nr:hypothetical protein [Puia sp.]
MFEFGGKQGFGGLVPKRRLLDPILLSLLVKITGNIYHYQDIVLPDRLDQESIRPGCLGRIQDLPVGIRGNEYKGNVHFLQLPCKIDTGQFTL